MKHEQLLGAQPIPGHSNKTFMFSVFSFVSMFSNLMIFREVTEMATNYKSPVANIKPDLFFRADFGSGISFPNLVGRSTLELTLSKLCAVPFALQRKGEEEGWPAKRATRKKGLKKKQVRNCHSHKRWLEGWTDGNHGHQLTGENHWNSRSKPWILPEHALTKPPRVSCSKRQEHPFLRSVEDFGVWFSRWILWWILLWILGGP